MQWICRAVGRDASTEAFTAVLHKYNAHCKSSLVLRAVLRAFSGAHFGSEGGPRAMVALVKLAKPGGGVSTAVLYEV